MSKKAAPRRPVNRSVVVSRRVREDLVRANLWPIQPTADYCRRVAIDGPDYLCRAVLRLIAEGNLAIN